MTMPPHHRPASSASIPAQPAECTQEHRVLALERRADSASDWMSKADGRMHEGDTRFARLEERLMSVSEKLAELSETIRAAVRWVLGAVGLVVGGAVLWAVVHAYQPTPVAGPPATAVHP